MSSHTGILGIDEAGRGPLIGDMFVAGVVVGEESLETLRQYGVKDSKALSRSMRRKLFNIVLTLARCAVVRRFSPREIDVSNINELYEIGVSDIVNTVSKLGFNVSRIYVDSTSSRRLRRRVRSIVPSYVEVIVEPRADEKYVVVGAASIVAKYLRDTHVRVLHKAYGDFGSGYPSDPKTISWIEELVRKGGELPGIVRLSWRTLRRFGVGVGTKKYSLLKWFKIGEDSSS